MKLTKAAKKYAEDNAIEIDREELSQMVDEALDRPSDATFRDFDLFHTHTLAFHTPAWNLTDDYVIDQANYRSALQILEPLGAEAATVGHWTYSTFECIKIPILNKNGNILPAAVELYNLQCLLREYPVLDESLYSELECEVNDRAMTDAIEWEERQREIEFSDDQKYTIHSMYFELWGGHYETGYISEDELNEIIDRVLSGDVQEHQDSSLF